MQPEKRMKRLLHQLYETDQARWKYFCNALLISLIPTVILAVIVLLVMPGKSQPIKMPVIFLYFCLILIGPWIETVMMWPILSLLNRIMSKTITVAFASAVVWALIHSLSSPARGLVLWWPFLVFSICFIEWEKKSLNKAIVITAYIHMYHNLIAFVFIMLTQYLVSP